MNKEVIIIGAGPAGLTCGMQLARMGIGHVVLEKHEPGGLLHEAGLVENYPGYPNGIEAAKLVALMVRQAKQLGVEVLPEEALEVVTGDHEFKVITPVGQHTGRFLVMATGTVPVEWKGCSIPHEANGFIHYGVSSIRGSGPARIAVIGAGDAAFDYALQLKGDGHAINIFQRNEKIKSLPLLKERAFIKQGIEFFPGHSLMDIHFDPDEKHLELLFSTDTGSSMFIADHIVFATGRVPANMLIASLDEQQKKIAEEEGRLLYAGDLTNERARQSVIAAGDGMRVAMKIAEKLSG